MSPAHLRWYMDLDSPLSTEAKTELLMEYLRTRVETGNLYFKSKFIAAEVGLSPKEIGALLARIRNDSSTDIQIEKWSYTSATTWRLVPAQA